MEGLDILHHALPLINIGMASLTLLIDMLSWLEAQDTGQEQQTPAVHVAQRLDGL